MNTDKEILQIFKLKTIAIVGMSPKPERYSHKIGKYLIEHDYDVVPVNPGHNEILGTQSFPTLKDIPFSVDIVNVFRRSEFCEIIARESVEIGVKALWLQEGIVNDNAINIAQSSELLTVQDRCILKEHIRLIG